MKWIEVLLKYIIEITEPEKQHVTKHKRLENFLSPVEAFFGQNLLIFSVSVYSYSKEGTFIYASEVLNLIPEYPTSSAILLVQTCLTALSLGSIDHTEG